MDIFLAPVSLSLKIVSFFERYLTSDNDAIYSQEFFCPDGVRAAVRRNQMLIAVVDHQLVGALRAYKRKSGNIISLYQFAIAEDYRGQGILKKMLKQINDAPIEVACPTNSNFNIYYQKTGWKLSESGEKLNRWIFV